VTVSSVGVGTEEADPQGCVTRGKTAETRLLFLAWSRRSNCRSPCGVCEAIALAWI